MKPSYLFIYFTIIIGLPVLAGVDYDKKTYLNGVLLHTGKEDSTRHYLSSYSKTFPYSLEVVRNGITNFSEKCDNGLKSKRKFIKRNADCKYHLEQLIESIVIKDISQDWKKKPFETERYLVARKIYRRGNYANYDLIRVMEEKDSKGQRQVTISFSMLNDKEVDQYIKKSFKKYSDFTKRSEIFILTEIGSNQTELKYNYHAETEHWLLNKEILVPQVFASLGRKVSEIFKIVDAASTGTKRKVASH